MLDTIVLEIRDRGTLIPCMATRIRTKPEFHAQKTVPTRAQASAAALISSSPTVGTCEAYLLKRSGYTDKSILVTILDGEDKRGNKLRTYGSHDIYAAIENEYGRTIPEALKYIFDDNHFQLLLLDQKQQVPTDDAYNLSNSTSIGVIDVEYILGESPQKKKSGLYK